MAKRVRGSSTRPGQRARRQRIAQRPAAVAPTVVSRPTTLTPEEEARAAELEAQIMAEERAAEEALRRSRERGRRSADVEVAARSGSLAVRASAEYGYVVRDVRRVALIGGGLVAFLVGLWAVTEVTGIGPF
ncbi:MAG TPA: hypothetical protein VIH00_13420 [Candidatus Limnocylindrales bacterium]